MTTVLRVSLIGLMVLHSACSVHPWVKPYERGRLADPIMSWDRDALSRDYLVHLHECREGSRGATGTWVGGCGWN